MHQPGGFHFVTWRLAGSLPGGRVFDVSKTSSSDGALFGAMDRVLDGAEWGPTHLRVPELAGIVAEEMRRGFGEDGIVAWVVMPNHVHVVTGPTVGDLVQAIRMVKGRSARRCHLTLGCLEGTAFWQEEYYDRWIRSPEELRRVVRYVELNPVRAGRVSVGRD